MAFKSKYTGEEVEALLNKSVNYVRKELTIQPGTTIFINAVSLGLYDAPCYMDIILNDGDGNIIGGTSAYFGGVLGTQVYRSVTLVGGDAINLTFFDSQMTVSVHAQYTQRVLTQDEYIALGDSVASDGCLYFIKE